MRSSSPDRYLFIALLALLIWLPLPLGSNRIWAWALFEILLQAIAAGWLLLALMGRTRLTSAFRKAWPILLLWLAWLLFLQLQSLGLPPDWLAIVSPKAAQAYALLPDAGADKTRFTLSLDPAATQSFLQLSWAYFLLFCLILLMVSNTGRIRWLVAVVVVSGAFQALYGSLMVLSGTEYLLFERKEGFIGNATGTFVNRNHLAGYLNMAMALGIGWLMTSGDGRQVVHWRQRLRNWLRFFLSRKMQLRLLLVIMAIGLVMTHSRMGNAAFFSSLLITGVIWLLLRKKRPKRGAVLVLVSILLLDIVVMGHWFGLDKLVQRLQQTSVERETRDDVIRESLPYAEDFWLLGSGAGSFYSTFPMYMGEGSHSAYRYAHNDFLQFFLETGLLGTSLLALMVLSSLVNAFKAMARRSRHALKAASYGSVMGMLAILIHSATDFNLQIPSNAAMFVVLMALAWVAAGLSRRAD